MSGIDAAIGTLVQQLLSGLGPESGLNLTGSCVLNLTQRNYEPLSGSAPAAADVSFPLDCTPPDPFHQSQINGTSIRQGDFVIWISAAQLAGQPGAPDGGPAPSMTLTFAGQAYSVAGVEPVYVGNTPVLYGLHCRQ